MSLCDAAAAPTNAAGGWGGGGGGGRRDTQAGRYWAGRAGARCDYGCTINKTSWHSHIRTRKHLKKLEEVKEEVKEEIKEVEPVEEINKKS
jgi:hypothetical protein